MAVTVTLAADINVYCEPNRVKITIPAGTAIIFPNAVQTFYQGTHNDGTNRNFATALCSAADQLVEAAGMQALIDNLSQFTPQTVAGVIYNVGFGPAAQATFSSANISPSASPSASPSTSTSASLSASASASTSASRSASLSASPSASRSASPSASPSAS
jgi:hypothetical protein